MEDRSASVLKGATLKSLVYNMVSLRDHALVPYCLQYYASKLFEIVKAHLPDVRAYADDTQLYLSFNAGSEDNQTEAVDAAQECI